jgi:23S rRNA (adenine2503-C2)-methyltransferase
MTAATISADSRRTSDIVNLRDLDRPALEAAVAPFGIGPDVAGRLFSVVHRDGVSVLDDRSVRGLSKEKAAALAGVTSWPDLEVLDRRRSDDGFVKYLFRLPDGNEIEAVRIPLPDPAAARALKELRRQGGAPSLQALPTAKYTLCLSSQAGCALACDFCATGKLGGIRSLRTWEILAQHRHIAAEADHPIRGVVFMGMGEPFLNYENVIRAARILSDPAGAAIAAKAISISTAGVVPAIRRFTAEKHHFRLIVSLGAPTSLQRRSLMPIENRWPLPELMAAVRAYAAESGQRVSIAYVAIGGVNTSPEHARALAELLAGLKVKLNIIDVSDQTGQYRPPTADELSAFRDALGALGAPVVRRYSGGNQIGAGCGTLSASRRGGLPEKGPTEAAQEAVEEATDEAAKRATDEGPSPGQPG